MLEVYKSPQTYLCGPFTKIGENPFCTADQREEQHFVIVGGGIAGLTSARLLLSVGHKVSRPLNMKWAAKFLQSKWF